MRSILVGLALAATACSQQNPLFMVGSASATDGATSGAPGTSGAPPTTTDATSSSPMTGETSAPSEATLTTTVGPDTTAAEATTQAIDSDATATGTTQPAGTGTDTGESSTGEPSTGEPSTGDASTGDGTTGEPPDEGILLELYPLCPVMATMWQFEGNPFKMLACNGGGGAPSVTQQPQFIYKDNIPLEKVLDVMLPATPGKLVGRFDGLKLAPDKAPQAKLGVGVLCFKSPDPQVPCGIDYQIDLLVGGQQAYVKQGALADDGVNFVEFPIGGIPAVAAGQEFSVVLTASSGDQALKYDRAFFIRPRIFVP